jgi:hypothetical protein
MVLSSFLLSLFGIIRVSGILSDDVPVRVTSSAFHTTQFSTIFGGDGIWMDIHAFSFGYVFISFVYSLIPHLLTYYLLLWALVFSTYYQNHYRC